MRSGSVHQSAGFHAVTGTGWKWPGIQSQPIRVYFGAFIFSSSPRVGETNCSHFYRQRLGGKTHKELPGIIRRASSDVHRRTRVETAASCRLCLPIYPTPRPNSNCFQVFRGIFIPFFLRFFCLFVCFLCVALAVTLQTRQASNSQRPA